MRRGTTTKVTRAMDLGIDLGSINTVVASERRGVLFDEPSYVAVDTKDGRIAAFGYEAAFVVGQAEASLQGLRPLSRGQIAHADALYGFLANVLAVASAKNERCQSASIPVSSLLPEKDRKLITQMAVDLGVSEIHFISDLLACAIACRRDREPDRPLAIIDIGADLASWGIVHNGRVAQSGLCEFGGSDLSADLIELLRRRYGLTLAPSQADSVLASLGCRGYRNPQLTAQVGGKSSAAGNAPGHIVSAGDVADAIGGRIDDLIRRLERFFGELPENTLRAFVDDGVDLCGGCALMPGLADELAQRLGLPVNVSANPLHMGALGAARALVLRH